MKNEKNIFGKHIVYFDQCLVAAHSIILALQEQDREGFSLGVG